MWFPRWVAVFGVILALILLVGGAVAAATTAPGTSSTSVPARLAMPTYAGPDGARIPLGSCAVIQGGKVLVVACDSPLAKAYKAHLLAVARQAGRQKALLRWGGLLALALGVAGVIAALRRKRRSGTGADAPVTAGADVDSEKNDAAGRLGA